MADHCRQYALSDPKDKDYQSPCDHAHDDICDRCEELSQVLHDISAAVTHLSAQSNVHEDSRDEVLFTTDQARHSILAWKAHLLRSVNQDQARLDVLENLDETSCFLVEDWAMKFLPRKYRESQTDWFGKRGLSWHVTVAIRREASQDLSMMTFTHVFQSCAQDSPAVQAIMADVIGKLKSVIPALQKVFYRQDNAGCYRSGQTVVGAMVAGQLHGVKLQRLDFSDPQGGKGSCDRKAASIKAHIRVHLNEGHDIETASDMVNAMQSRGGVPGLSVTLCDGVVSPPNPVVTKITGISSIANVEYGPDHIRVWKAYAIGPGKKIFFSKLKVPDRAQLHKLTIPPGGETTATFKEIKSRSKVSRCDGSSVKEDILVTDSVRSGLHLCPEEGCTKVYQRYSGLQHHLDCGRHERALENETMLDKAARGYAMMLEGQFSSIPRVAETASTSVRCEEAVMGWALKYHLTARTRFTDKQRNYMTEKFLIGETTGRKASPAQVARSMFSAKDPSGERLFSGGEFLTTQQVANFFSRLSAKRALSGAVGAALDEMANEEEEDGTEAAIESAFDEVRNLATETTALQHPVCCDQYNLCDLRSKSELTSFTTRMLRNICDALDIDTADISSKAKTKYVDRLGDFLQHCSCCK